MKKKHVFKKLFLSVGILFAAIVLCFSTYYFSVTFSTKLNTQKIDQANATNIQLFDFNNTVISDNLISNKSYVQYSDLPQHTIDAFVSVEDKRYFDHNGIDYIRILGAIKNNIFNPDKKQGGSTITQQVIKNTQLNSEKTIKRKLKELKLARQLEKKYSKQQILEMYLNSIYFGNGCYGIENASKYYFDKSCKDLTIAESALLASTINAPSIYDPVSNSNKANKRKELVLQLMLDNNKISDSEYTASKQENIIIAKATKKYYNQYYKGVIAEACKILNVTETQLKNLNVKINTYYNPTVQKYLEELIVSGKYTAYNTNSKLGSIVLDNNSKSVIAFASNSGLDLLNTYRQPGSVIKPIMVYAPAFESGKYSPASYINDQPVNINGYQPENASKNYLGYVNIKDSIAKSLNIPAVKVLNEIGINYAKIYAKSMGINFEINDNNLALALGGFTKGTTIKQLCDAYMCFANDGNYTSSSFISSIIKDDQVVYTRKVYNRTPVKSSVAYLINDCLKETAINGTAKRMLSLNIPLCSKTGTVGTNNGNTDAYNISYTTEHTLCCWIGANNTSNTLPSSVNGATYPTIFNIAVLKDLYKNHKPDDFIKPNDISYLPLNQDALSEHTLERDDTGTTFAYFDNRYLPPQTKRSKLDVTITINNFENNKPNIIFDAKRDISYEIYRKDETQECIIHEINFVNDKVCYTDHTAESGKIYEYYVVAKNKTDSKRSNTIKLLAN